MDFTDQMSQPVKAVHQVWKPDGKHRKKARVEGTFLQAFLYACALRFASMLALLFRHFGEHMNFGFGSKKSCLFAVTRERDCNCQWVSSVTLYDTIVAWKQE